MPVIDTSNPIELSKALILGYKPQGFLRKMCTTITHGTKSFLIDVSKKTRVMSPYIRDDEDGTFIERDGYDTLSFTPPKIGGKRNITAKDLEKRAAGQGIVEISAENSSAEMTQNQLVIDDLLDLQAYNERREEHQIAQILQTGKVEVLGKDIVSPIPTDNIITLAAADRFDAAGSNPITWMRNISRKKVVLRGGSAVKKAIFGGKAIDAFLENAAVKDFLDKKHIMFGDVEPTPDQTFEGVTYWGKIGGVEIYTYDEYFYDDVQKKDSPMIAEDRVILIGGNPRFEMHYGAVFDGARGTINKVQSYAWEWIEGGKTKWRELESHPLFVPVNGGSIVSAKVI